MNTQKNMLNAFEENGFKHDIEEPSALYLSVKDKTITLSLGVDCEIEEIYYYDKNKEFITLYRGLIPTYEFAKELIKNLDFNNL